MPAFSDRETVLLAVSMDDVSHARQMVDLHGLSYPILMDPSGTVAQRYGVFNLLGDGLAAPAIFIIDKQGLLRWQHVSQGATDRPTPELILRELDTLG